MGKLLTGFSKQFDRLNSGLALIAGAIVGVSAIIVCYEVFMRYVLERPTTWVNEVSEMFLIYTTFLGTTWVLRMDGHTKVDIIVSVLTKKRQEAMGIFQDILSLVFCAIFTWLTWESFWDAVITQERTAGGLFSIPLWVMYIVIPVGCFLMSIQLIIRIVERFAYLSKHAGGSDAEGRIE